MQTTSEGKELHLGEMLPEAATAGGRPQGPEPPRAHPAQGTTVPRPHQVHTGVAPAPRTESLPKTVRL